MANGSVARVASGRRWRRLLLDLGQALIEAGPAGRAACPDRHGRTGDLRIVERAGTHENQVRAGFRGAEEVRAAALAEAAMRDVAAVGDHAVVARFALDLQRRAREADIYRGATRADVLAHPAPAHAGDDRRRINRVAHGPAQATTGVRHVPKLIEDGRRGKG